MRFKSENIDKLIESKRFMNQFETGTSGGTINANYRRQATEQLFGIKGGRFKKSDLKNMDILRIKTLMKIFYTIQKVGVVFRNTEM